MPYFLGDPKVRFVDNNNEPLVSGLLYTYAGGTTTPLATYPTIADAVALTNANNNPVVLDSRGEATVVLRDVAYKFVLKDSTGSTTYWTVDNVYFSTASTITDPGGFPVLNMSGTLITFGATDTTGITIGNTSTSTVTLAAGGTTLVIGTASSGARLQSSNNIVIQAPKLVLGSDEPIADSSANNQLSFSKTASAVNYIQIKNAATAGRPSVTAAGSDTNVGLDIGTKGSGGFRIVTAAGTFLWPSAITSNAVAKYPMTVDSSGTMSATAHPGLFMYAKGTFTIAGGVYAGVVITQSYNCSGVVANTGGGNFTLTFGYTSGTPAATSQIPVATAGIGLNAVGGGSAWVSVLSTTSITLNFQQAGGFINGASYQYSIFVYLA